MTFEGYLDAAIAVRTRALACSPGQKENARAVEGLNEFKAWYVTLPDDDPLKKRFTDFCGVFKWSRSALQDLTRFRFQDPVETCETFAQRFLERLERSMGRRGDMQLDSDLLASGPQAPPPLSEDAQALIAEATRTLGIMNTPSGMKRAFARMKQALSEGATPDDLLTIVRWGREMFERTRFSGHLDLAFLWGPKWPINLRCAGPREEAIFDNDARWNH